MSKTALLETCSHKNTEAFDRAPVAIVIEAPKQPQQQTIFVTLGKEHARQMARLHIEGISTGFISSLGLDFVTAMYEGIVASKQSYGFVTDSGELMGFVAFTTNVGKLYKSVIFKHGLRFGILLANKLFSFARIKKVAETLLYPNRAKKLDLPSAELLSIVIAPEARSYGMATELVLRGLEEYRNLDIDRVKVLVAAANVPANKLYRKCGFELVEQISSHGTPSNIYIAEILDTQPSIKLLQVTSYSGFRLLQNTIERLRPVAVAIAVALAHLFHS